MKRLLFFSVLTSMVFSTTYYPDESTLGEWRVHNESLNLSEEDKQVHALGSAGLYFLMKSKGASTTTTINTIVWLGLFKECADALVPYEQYGSWGGDGWSNADLIANALGVGTAWLIDEYWHPKIDINLKISFYYSP